MGTSNKYFFVFIFLFSLFFSSLVSSVSLKSPSGVPDQCFAEGSQRVHAYLEDYYNLDSDDSFAVEYVDPSNGQTLYLYSGFASLNLEYFELGYYFYNGLDFLHIDSLNNGNFSTTLTLYGCGSDNYDPSRSGGLDGDYSSVLPSCDSEETIDTIFVNITDSCYSSPTPNYGQNGLFDDLEAYYKFDESSGSVVNDVFNNNDGDLIGNAFLNAIGILNGAVDFYGDYSHYISLGHQTSYSDPLFFNGSSVFSMSGWFKSDLARSSNAWGSQLFHLDSYGGTPNDVGLMYVNNTPNLAHFSVLSGGVLGATSWFINMSDYVGSYSHIVFVFNGSAFNLYLNNNLLSPVVTGSDTPNVGNGYEFKIGSNIGINYFDYVDEVAIYSRVLSSEEVSSLYNSAHALPFEYFETTSLNSPNSTANITNQTLSYSDSVHIDLSSYFTTPDYYKLLGISPFGGEYILNTWTYSPRNGFLADGYFDSYLYPNGSMVFNSYNRTYLTSFEVSACDGNETVSSCEYQTFFLNISGSQADLVRHTTFPYSFSSCSDGWCVIDDSLTSINTYYGYWDEITIGIPTSNYTGVLLNSVEYSPYISQNGHDYIMYFTCSYGQNATSYYYASDVLFEVECNPDNVFLTLEALTNYNDTIYFYASNSLGSLSDSVLLFVDDPSLPPYANYQRVNSSYNFTSSSGAFSELFPDSSSVTPLIRYLLMALVFVSLFALLYVTVYRSTGSLSLLFYIAVPVSIILMFFFSTFNYLSPSYPLVLMVLFFFYLISKFLRGSV